MRYAGTLVLMVVPLLFSCLPKKPEAPLIAVPAGPLMQALERHDRSFRSLKAVASIELVRKERKRTLDTAGVVLDGQRRLRMEAYGPLGQSLAVIVWDGTDVLLRLPGNDRVTRTGPAGLARFFGEGLAPADLNAALSGAIPEAALAWPAALSCGQDDECILELRKDDQLRRIRVRYRPNEPDRQARLLVHELYDSGKLVYRVQFERMQEVSGYRIPISIVLNNPDKKVQLTVQYSDLDVNTLVSDESFVLTDETMTVPGN